MCVSIYISIYICRWSSTINTPWSLQMSTPDIFIFVSIKPVTCVSLILPHFYTPSTFIFVDIGHEEVASLMSVPTSGPT